MATMAAARKKAKGPVANIIELVVTVVVAIGLALLALARVIEGLSLGGEYGTSATYLASCFSANRIASSVAVSQA